MKNNHFFFDHGDITAEEANRRLVARPPGTFLLRNDPDTSIVVAFKTGRDSPAVQQVSIGREGRLRFQDTQYRTMDEFLHGTGQTLRIPLPFFDHGDIDLEETARRLDSKPKGTFLFRNSRDPGYFVIASQTGSAVEQKKIARSPENAFQYNQYTYEPTSIGDLLYRNQSTLTTPLPAPTQVAIYDGLTPQRTNALLSKAPKGTYLFRTSKSIAVAGALTLVYNAGLAGVQQLLLVPTPGGGYTIEDATLPSHTRSYLNLDAVLSAYKGILLHPYLGPIPDAPVRIVEGNRGGRTRIASSSWMRLVRRVHASRREQDSNALYRDSLMEASKLYRTRRDTRAGAFQW
jgi:hypothetical protein